MSKAWITQPSAKLKQLGPDACPWVCEWYTPAGKRRRKTFGPGPKGKRLADQFRDRVTAEPMLGTYGDRSKATWADLVAAYRELRFPHLDATNRKVTDLAVGHYERIARPKLAAAADTKAVARYAARRLAEPVRSGAVKTVAPATVNKELRHLKAVFAFGAEHGYLTSAPKVRMCKEPKRLPRVLEPDGFAALHKAADTARWPAKVPNVATADWWRGLFTFLYLTGWRIGETLQLGWADVDLEHGFVVTRAETNKAGRDERLPLHPVAVEALRPLRAGFSPVVFPWPHGARQLYDEFADVQRAAGFGKPFYGFHDFRRAFATYNAAGLGADTLQRMMRHVSFETTRRYIRLAEDLSPVKAKLFVPDVLNPAAGRGG